MCARACGRPNLEELFTIDAVIEIGPDTSLTNFKRSMDKLVQKLGVDIEISDHEQILHHRNEHHVISTD